MIKNVIFDLGNVLLRFSPMEYLRTKITDENKVKEVYREIFQSEEWLMLDRGVITEEEAIVRLVDRSLENGELIKLCMKQWYELLTPMEETIGILKKVKDRGYKTYVLSNFHYLAYENVISRCDFFQYFDGEVISYREKLLKPEMAIYHKLTTQYGIEPSESLFIDDTKVNVEGAGELGFKAILFSNPIDLYKQLVELDVLDKV